MTPANAGGRQCPDDHYLVQVWDQFGLQDKKMCRTFKEVGHVSYGLSFSIHCTEGPNDNQVIKDHMVFAFLRTQNHNM